MNNRYNPLFNEFILYGCVIVSCIVTYNIMPYVYSSFPACELSGLEFIDLFSSIPSEFHFQFVALVFYYILAFCLSSIIMMFGYVAVFLIHRISLRYIYSKPRRVYPVEKQKFFSLY